MGKSSTLARKKGSPGKYGTERVNSTLKEGGVKVEKKGRHELPWRKHKRASGRKVSKKNLKSLFFTSRANPETRKKKMKGPHIR